MDFVRIVPFGDCLPQRGADAKAARVIRFQGLVDQAGGLLHHAESAGTKPLRDVFGRRADQRHLEVVNDPGAVQNETAQPAALHHVDEDRVEAALDDVGAHGQDDGPPALVRGHETIDDVGDVQALQQARKQRPQVATGLPSLRIDEIGHVHLVLPVSH